MCFYVLFYHNQKNFLSPYLLANPEQMSKQQTNNKKKLRNMI